MRIRNIRIIRWRHFENISLALGEDAGLVCIVGANGTGKSHLLELISACAHRLGLSQGIELSRGDPFNDLHQFSFQMYLAAGVSQTIDSGLGDPQNFAAWDRTLTIDSHRTESNHSTVIEAGGIPDPMQRRNFANKVVEALRGAKDVHLVSLDADRAYPKKNLNIHEIAQAYETEWDTLEWTRGRSFKPTNFLYDEWIKYFLAQENQAGARLMQGIRRARERQEHEPRFEDHFGAYKSAIKKVLPHLVFTGVDSKKRALLFDTTGMELSFYHLSGGEREIAFLIGQIDRFQLKNGLFLLDEPELHLNADLIRNWVGYLTGTVETGQIWLATHSLEAVEAAGQHATFVLERNEETKKVASLARLDTRPILSALSRAVGTPAFSLSTLRFLFVEGEESVGERERFRKLSGMPQDVRFMECGSCNEVIRRVLAVKSLSNEAEGHIRIGGIIDRDMRSDAQAEDLLSSSNVFVLPVHEVENLFLHPRTVDTLLRQNARDHGPALDLIKSAADKRAGSWIFHYAMATRNAESLPKTTLSAKDLLKATPWSRFVNDGETVLEETVTRAGLDQEDSNKLKAILRVAVRAYEEKRKSPHLWKICEGKQVLNDLYTVVGFSRPNVMAEAALELWGRDADLLPEEVAALRNYIDSL